MYYVFGGGKDRSAYRSRDKAIKQALLLEECLKGRFFVLQGSGPQAELVWPPHWTAGLQVGDRVQFWGRPTVVTQVTESQIWVDGHEAPIPRGEHFSGLS